MGILISGVKHYGRFRISSMSQIGSGIQFLTPTGNIFTQTDSDQATYKLVTNALPEATVSFIVTAGGLPAGMTLDILTGEISGKSAPVIDKSTYFFTVTATTANGLSTARQFNVTILPSPTSWGIGDGGNGHGGNGPTDGLGNAIVFPESGYPITEFVPVDLYINGNTVKPHITYKIIEGTLPTGLNFDQSSGLISGMIGAIDAPSTYNLVVSAISFGAPKQINLKLVTAKNKAPVFEEDGDFGSVLGGAYASFPILALDPEKEEVSYSVAPGSSLPVGMRLNGRFVEGNLPVTTVADVEHTFSIRASDGHGYTDLPCSATALVNVAPTFTTPNKGSFATGESVSIPVAAIDPLKLSAISINLVSGSLPQGLSYADGMISGTVAEAGSFTVVFEASNGELTTQTQVLIECEQNEAPVWQTQSGLLSTTLAYYNVQTRVVAADPNGRKITYSIVGGALPPRIFLNETTGAISGTTQQVAAEEQTFDFTLRASDGVLHTDREFSLSIKRNHDPIWDTAVSLGVARGGTFFTTPPMVAHDIDGQVVRLAVAEGGYPLGWSFDPVTRTASGTMPRATRDSILRLSMIAMDGSPGQGLGQTRRAFEVINLFNTMPEWSTPALLPRAIGAEAYSVSLVARHPGNKGFTFEIVEGVLPNGLTMSADARITGTAAEMSGDHTFAFTVRVTNEIGSADREFTIRFEENLPPIWVTPEGSLGSVLANNNITYDLLAEDPNGLPLTYEVKGDLPTGMILSGNRLSASMPVVEEDTTNEITVSVSDGRFEVERTFSLTTLANNDPIWVTGSALGSVLEGADVAISLSATDPERINLVYELTGVLPDGIELNGNVLRGVAPEVEETTEYSFGVSVSDGLKTISRTFFMTVENDVAPVWITDSDLGSFKSGAPLSIPLSANDPNNSSLEYELVSGTLPTGAFLVGSVISTEGYDFAASDEDQAFSFTIRVSDGRFSTDRTFSLTMLANLAPVWVSEGLLFEGSEDEAFSVTLDFYDPEGDQVTLVSDYIPSGYTVSGKVLSGKLGKVETDSTTPLTLVITDGSTEVSRTFTLKTNYASAPVFVTSPFLGTIREGRAINAAIVSKSGGYPVSYTASDLPGTMRISSDGVISGTVPLISAGTETISFKVTATNEFGSTEQDYYVVVANNTEPVWSTASGLILTKKEGEAFSTRVLASDKDDNKLEYTLESGDLPEGVTFNNGLISGQLTSVERDETFSFVVGVFDGSVRVDREFSIKVQNIVSFSDAEVITPTPASSATLITEGQTAGEWDSFTGAYNGLVTTSAAPTTAVLNHSVDVSPLSMTTATVTSNEVLTATMTAMVETPNHAFYTDMNISSVETEIVPSASLVYPDQAENQLFTDAKLSVVKTNVADQSATQTI